MPRELCKYGTACYRKNPSHFQEFNHPWLDGESKSADNPEPKQENEKGDNINLSPEQLKIIPKDEIKEDVEKLVESVKEESNTIYQEEGEKTQSKTLFVSADDILEIVDEKSTISDISLNKRKRSDSASSSHSSAKLPKADQIPNNPLNLYLTKVKGMDKSVNNFCSLSIIEILSSTWGQLQESAQFNYMFDVEWLLDKYPPCFRNLPILLVHQDKRETTAQLEAETCPYGNISLAKARLNDAFGTHHTKMMLLRYETSLRVVIHTANLIEQDWGEKTQGIWFSPLFPLFKECDELKDKSSTKFQTDLILYLRSYKSKAVDYWCEILKKYDMSEANVFIIGSTPGRHTGNDLHKYGHMKLRKVLSSNDAMCDKVQPNWPVIGQFSSIGSLGSKSEAWLQGEFLQSLGTTPKKFAAFTKPPLKLVFPCVEDVRNSLEGYPAGGSLPYSDSTHQKQLYLTKFLHRWKSDGKGRTRASPHIKSYFRVSPDMKQIHYAVLTSANLSKAAWGGLEKQSSQLCIRSYELGVLFLPKFFGSHDAFNVSESLLVDGDGEKIPISFPVPFDLPLTRYGEKDQPWRWDIFHKKEPDSKGNVWIPS